MMKHAMNASGPSRPEDDADHNVSPAPEVVPDPCKIAAAARAVGLSEHRIREYERAGLIRPAREPRTGDRLFTAAEIAQLRTFRRLVREQGYTLATLRDLIRRTPCWNLADCAAMHACSVPRDPFTPCYEQRARGIPVACDTECARCAIYCTRGKPPTRIVVLTRRESGAAQPSDE